MESFNFTREHFLKRWKSMSGWWGGTRGVSSFDLGIFQWWFWEAASKMVHLEEILVRSFRSKCPYSNGAPTDMTTEVESVHRAILCKCPRDLYTLWDEYEKGISGNKPARDFTPKERGRCKSNYSRRLPFWQLVNKLVARGHTSERAIDKIMQVYGPSMPVTKIIRQLAVEKRNGWPHPSFN